MQDTDQDRPSILRRALSGGVLLLTGLIMLAVAWDYPVGRLTQMRLHPRHRRDDNNRALGRLERGIKRLCQNEG